MEKTEKFFMRRYSKKTATNIYAAPMRGVNNFVQQADRYACKIFCPMESWLYSGPAYAETIAPPYM